MIFEISHQTLYTFKSPVYLEPHVLHLHPRNAPFQKISNYKLAIDPEPAIVSEFLDLEGNRQSTIYFNNITDHLSIKTSFHAETCLYSPYDFIIYPFEAEMLPFTYPEHSAVLLRPYLETEANSHIEAYTREMAEEVQWATLPFLQNLTNRIHSTFKYDPASTIEPMSPAATFEHKRGSSIELVQLQMAMCRSIGLATRFVNGYYFSNIMGAQQLHAWLEVYIPGAGWRGFDPTYGVAVSNKHISLAASAYPSHIHPIIGTYLGSCIGAIEHNVNVQKVEKAEMV